MGDESEPGQAGGQGLAAGTEVTLRLPDGTAQTFRVVATPAEIAAGAEDTTLTSDSPLCQALANSREGGMVSFPTAEGRTQVEVISIRPPS